MSRQSPDGPASDETIRRPAVAGRFYPGQARALADLVDTLLDAVPLPDATTLASAYVVPHAGYPYSGPTAAAVYARLRRHADRIARVVLIGPAHYVPLDGCAATGAGRWSTPLGAATIDREAVDRLAGSRWVAVDDRPHEPEHSLEVQVPFLQRALPESVPLVPVLVGASGVEDVAAVLADLPPGPGTVLLCSTDLSHYLDLPTARERDARTAAAVLDLAPERIGTRDACGVFALRGLLGWARVAGLTPRLLHQCTSAEATGDASRVVGYAAFEFTAR